RLALRAVERGDGEVVGGGERVGRVEEGAASMRETEAPAAARPRLRDPVGISEGEDRADAAVIDGFVLGDAELAAPAPRLLGRLAPRPLEEVTQVRLAAARRLAGGEEAGDGAGGRAPRRHHHMREARMRAEAGDLAPVRGDAEVLVEGAQLLKQRARLRERGRGGRVEPGERLGRRAPERELERER